MLDGLAVRHAQLLHDAADPLSAEYSQQIILQRQVKARGTRIALPAAAAEQLPVDARRIQEHFYNLDKNDVIARFFHEKNSFLQEEVEGVSQIDYVKDLTVVAIVGEFGFGRVVGIGEYLIDSATNVAEVAFSLSKEYQKKGLGKILLKKLAAAAVENDIAGLVAYTSPQNRGMIKLFNQLPYKVSTFFDGDMLTLNCKFNEPL
jgi:GNAT superfamily N-acetyltransferase